MATLDVFNQDAFSVISLTDSINKVPFKPGRIGQLGMFVEDNVSTTTIVVEEDEGVLIVVPPTPRGAPGSVMTKNARTARSFIVPHFEINDAVYAEEVQNVRAWGSESDVQTVMGKVGKRLQSAVDSMGVTQELARIGAVKGIVTYADGSTLNLFTEFGVSQEAEIDFDLDNASPASGALRKKCVTAARLIDTNLGGMGAGQLRAFCGDNFFDDLLAHSEVRATYTGWNEAQILRDSYLGQDRGSWGIFEFGGIVWENYRGVVGSTSYIDSDKCHIFPMGVPGLFKTVYAPADYMETVNTMGQRLYSKQYAMGNGKGVHLDSQMNNIEYCTRPKTLLKGKRT